MDNKERWHEKLKQLIVILEGSPAEKVGADTVPVAQRAAGHRGWGAVTKPTA